MRLTGLSPATDYRYRFVAQSEGGSSAGEGRSLTTFVAPGEGGGGCPNEAFRTGPSAKLPDCRAYEMVSPVDKEGGNIFATIDAVNRLAQHNQSATSGERFTYTSYRAFADPEASPAESQYIATRDPGSGWSTANISPPRGIGYFPPGGAAKPNPSQFSEYQAFSPDLCSAWLNNNAFTAPPLAPGAVPFNYNLYRRANCGSGAGGYAALGRDWRIGRRAAGHRRDGGIAIFRTKRPPDAGRGERGRRKALLHLADADQIVHPPVAARRRSDRERDAGVTTKPKPKTPATRSNAG